MVIRRVGPLSVAKIAGVLYAIIGLLIGAIFSLISMVMGSAMSQANPEMPAFAGMMFGVGAIIALPIFYGLLGFITTLIAAAIYNLVAGWVGGIELDVT